jgi:hypothetical protein
VERQLARKAKLMDEGLALTTHLRAKESEAIKFARQKPDYVKLEKELEAAEADREEAKASGDMQKRLDASGRFNRARLAIEKIESLAPVNYIDAIELRKKIEENEKSLRGTEEALRQSAEWRNKLIDAMRNGFRPHGPGLAGSRGIPGEVKVERIVSKDTAIVYSLVPWGIDDTLQSKEGVDTVSVTMQPIHFSIGGIDTSKMKEGSNLVLNQNIDILYPSSDDRFGIVFIARRKESEEEKLLDAVMHLKGHANLLPKTGSAQ